MKKTRKFSILTAILLSFALLFIIPASAARTWTATLEGDITGDTGTEPLTFKKGYWFVSPMTYTFVNDQVDWGVYAGSHTGHLQISGPSQLDATINIRWRDGPGEYVLVVRGTYDFTESPGNVIITTNTAEYDHFNIWYYPDSGGFSVVWSGMPIFTITIPLAPD